MFNITVSRSSQAKPHDTLDLCVLLNDNLAQTVRSNPRRFVGLGTLPMQAPDLAVLEMRRCVKELGFPGVQIGSHINNWDLNAAELFPFYAVRHCILLFMLPSGKRHHNISGCRYICWFRLHLGGHFIPNLRPFVFIAQILIN